MEQLLQNIIDLLKRGEQIDGNRLAQLVRQANTGVSDVSKHVSKKKLLPFYLELKAASSPLLDDWGVTEAVDEALLRTLRSKPRRTSSGVATVTLITRPQTCSGSCVFCPNDIRMPKSYLSDEPACRRAERNFFDPYLQMASRLHTLEQMGHVTDKVEVIILGGTWCDYPQSYQTWFVCELFKALNASGEQRKSEVAKRLAYYRGFGLSNDDEFLATRCKEAQDLIDQGKLSYNQAYGEVYGPKSIWPELFAAQVATIEELEEQHRINEDGVHRVVGLVIETRPDSITSDALMQIRRLGCTKVQTGVQSLSNEVLALNKRHTNCAQIAQAFELLRLFGFKIHAHFMLNLYGSNLTQDSADYKTFVSDGRYMPDEIKLYPCALIGSTELVELYEQGSWTPYAQEELTGLLVECMRATPAFARVSRMVRDFSADDIVAGVKKTNLRQDVDSIICSSTSAIQEIRTREINGADVALDQLELVDCAYETTATHEHFLQWVTAENKLAGFLRLSLPKQDVLENIHVDLPIQAHEAMIREVHVYGKVAALGEREGGAQHLGLGSKLVDTACTIAKQSGFERINVISAIGTRRYYERLGFSQVGLYHQKTLS